MQSDNINKHFPKYFDKVLVLTVPRFKERQERVSKRLQGIPFEFFYGADKNSLTDRFKQENYHYDPQNSLSITQTFKPLNDGEIACALSHRNIYEEIVQQKWKRVLIFEDDVVPAGASLSYLTGCIEELPPDWELFYLGYLKNEQATFGKKLKRLWYSIQSRLGFSRMNPSMISKMLPRPYSVHLLRAGFHDCTHAYAISLEGAKKLLDAQSPITYRADNLLSAMVLKNELNAFISKKPLFNQEIFSDTTHESHVREQRSGS